MYIAENTLKPLSLVNTMSSTAGVQNLITNVFRPTFIYDSNNHVYSSKLELANIDTVSANAVTAFAANIGDISNNMYVGVGAGNNHSILAATSNAYDTFVGTLAGSVTSNVQNSVFLGYRAGSGSIAASNSISIGANTINGGNSNIYIGCGTGITSGSNNTFIGPGLSADRSGNNKLLIGSGANTAIVGDLSNNRIGINMATLADDSVAPILISLDVNGYARVGTTANGGLGINKRPGSYALDVNGDMQVSDGYGVMTVSKQNGTDNSTFTFSNTATYPDAVATMQVTGGYFSVRGSIAVPHSSSATIGKWKRGNVLIFADSGTGAYVSTMYMCSDPDGPSVFAMTTTVTASNTTIINNSGTGSNIQISNGSAGDLTYSYMITYFPSL